MVSKGLIKKISVPTGHICILNGDGGELEFLSIGDYGKKKNIKADFMGMTRDLNGVPHGKLLPLSEKWVITISTQYGCSMGCKFCDVPLVGPGKNATINDLLNQVQQGILLHPEIKHTKRLNLHYARMGEPTFNENIFEATEIIYKDLKKRGFGFHPVISTMMPKNNPRLSLFINKWLDIKDKLGGNAGLQISINSTNSKTRESTMPNAMDLEKISKMFFDILFVRLMPKGRKIALNFAITDENIDAKMIRELFNPNYFMCKITPMHLTNQCIKNKIETKDGYEQYYPYRKIENDLKEVGFDVLVFIPSKEEDESKITCGNAILCNKNR